MFHVKHFRAANMRYKQEVSISETIETICRGEGLYYTIIGARRYGSEMSLLLSGGAEILRLMPLLPQIELNTSLTRIRLKKTSVDGIIEMLGGA